MNVEELKQWPVMRLVNRDLTKVKAALVCHNSALLIVEDEDLEPPNAEGNNEGEEEQKTGPDAVELITTEIGDHCFGLCGEDELVNRKIIDELRGKEVIDFAVPMGVADYFGIRALCADGSVYCWGKNQNGQLGDGTTGAKTVPGKCAGLAEYKIVSVDCGLYHTVFLTTDGHVYVCGAGASVGSLTGYVAAPVRITSTIGSLKIVAIACGQHFTACISEVGKLYTWGLNNNGELGLGHANASTTPSQVCTLAEIDIKQIQCGNDFFLARSAGGDIYVCGRNDPGTGTGLASTEKKPVQIIIEETNSRVQARFADIAARMQTMAAISVTGNIYVWGRCNGRDIKKPLLIEMPTLDMAFGYATEFKFMRKCVQMSGSIEDTRIQKYRESFDQADTANVIFVVENRDIHANSEILKINCEYFRGMFRSEWKETSDKKIQITNYSYDVYHAFIKYLYTGEVNVVPDIAQELLQLADEYLEEKLKHRCELILQKSLVVDNVARLFELARRHDAKSLMEMCVVFAFGVLTAVTQSDGYNDMDAKAAKELIRRCGEKRAFKF